MPSKLERAERLLNVYWEGPFKLEELPLKENHVLYMLCGTHGLYGRNVPLYLGKTERSISTRIPEHKWIHEEPDPVSVYVASIGDFTNWDAYYQADDYPIADSETISAVEHLLICSHWPVYNRQSKEQGSAVSRHIRIFNTGRRATLFPEISGLYWKGP